MHKIVLPAVLVCLCGPGAARDFSDPTWPCIQRKAEHLSVGVMWPLPLQPNVTLAEKAEHLADQLTLRRITAEEAQRLIDAFAANTPDADTGLYGAIFERAFKKMDQERTRLIRGIERYSLAQIALSDQIETLRTDMNALMQHTAPDYDRIDSLEETLDWNERIFKDRASALTYVCESPILLEKRIYTIAQALLAKTTP